MKRSLMLIAVKGGDFLQRPGCLFVSSEKGNNRTGTYDGHCEPDDAAKWPAQPILFPHGDQRENDKDCT
jgi:hypothetical protein